MVYYGRNQTRRRTTRRRPTAEKSRGSNVICRRIGARRTHGQARRLGRETQLEPLSGGYRSYPAYGEVRSNLAESVRIELCRHSPVPNRAYKTLAPPRRGPLSELGVAGKWLLFKLLDSNKFKSHLSQPRHLTLPNIALL